MKSILDLARPEILALRAYASARSLQASVASKTLLDANEAPDEDDVDAQRLNRYPDPQPPALVERLASLYGVSPESLLVGRGSDEAIDLLVRTFCRAGQDAVLITPPTYGMYEVAAQIQGAAVVRAPLRRDGATFVIDESLVEARLEGVKIVFLCSPNNPTGTAFEPVAIEQVVRITSGRSLLVLDEAYAEMSDRPSAVSLIDRWPHVVVLRTLSKAWALAGARCGAALGSPELIALLHKVRAPYPLSTPAVSAALSATTPAQARRLAGRVRATVAERERVAAALRERGARVFPSAANFLLVQVPDPRALMEATARRGILVRDRSAEVDRAVRVTIGTPAENDSFLSAASEALGA